MSRLGCIFWERAPGDNIKRWCIHLRNCPFTCSIINVNDVSNVTIAALIRLLDCTNCWHLINNIPIAPRIIIPGVSIAPCCWDGAASPLAHCIRPPGTVTPCIGVVWHCLATIKTLFFSCMCAWCMRKKRYCWRAQRKYADDWQKK